MIRPVKPGELKAVKLFDKKVSYDYELDYAQLGLVFIGLNEELIPTLYTLERKNYKYFSYNFRFSQSSGDKYTILGSISGVSNFLEDENLVVPRFMAKCGHLFQQVKDRYDKSAGSLEETIQIYGAQNETTIISHCLRDEDL